MRPPWMLKSWSGRAPKPWRIVDSHPGSKRLSPIGEHSSRPVQLAFGCYRPKNSQTSGRPAGRHTPERRSRQARDAGACDPSALQAMDVPLDSGSASRRRTLHFGESALGTHRDVRYRPIADLHAPPLSSAERTEGPQLRQIIHQGRSVLVVVLLTAALGATWNTIYEFAFRPDLWRTDPPLGRWLFAVAVTSPFILLALLTIGLPVTKLLFARRAETPISYAVSGGLGGLLFWPLVTVPFSWFDGVPSSVLPTSIAPLPLIVETSAYGIICAVFWWWFARRNSDKAAEV